jgi:hypothetical protein
VSTLDLSIFQSWEVAYLNFVDKPLGGPFHSLRLFDLGDLLVASPVVPTLTPDINMLAPIMGTPLDLLHFVVGARLGLLALGALATIAEDVIGLFPRSGTPGALASMGGSST